MTATEQLQPVVIEGLNLKQQLKNILYEIDKNIAKIDKLLEGDKP